VPLVIRKTLRKRRYETLDGLLELFEMISQRRGVEPVRIACPMEKGTANPENLYFTGNSFWIRQMAGAD